MSYKGKKRMVLIINSDISFVEDVIKSMYGVLKIWKTDDVHRTSSYSPNIHITVHVCAVQAAAYDTCMNTERLPVPPPKNNHRVVYSVLWCSKLSPQKSITLLSVQGILWSMLNESGWCSMHFQFCKLV